MDRRLAVRVLVTGGLGFIGSAVTARLLARGITATAVDNGWHNGLPLGSDARATVALRRAGIQSVGGMDAVRDADLLDPTELASTLTTVRPTHVVHLAGLSRADLARGDEAIAPNVVLTQRLLTAMASVGGVQRFLLASSSMVYGHFEELPATEAHPCLPVEPYGASKLACEILAQSWGRAHGTEVTVVRPSAVYGPGDFNGRVPSRFVTAAMAGEPLVVHRTDERLDFTYIDDVADGVVQALLAPVVPGAAGEVFNLAAGDSRTVTELAEIVQAYVPGTRVTVQSVPSGRPRRGTLAIDKARRLLGYAPVVSLEEGVLRLLSAHGMAPTPTVAVPRRSLPAPVALSRPSLGEPELAAAARAWRSGWLTHGPETQRFEEAFAQVTGVGHALAVNSCTSALVLALRAAGITGEVLVPAFTFAATANAVVLAGATPVFVDVDPAVLGMDPVAAAAAVTSRTEAMIAVHMAGHPCAIGALRDLARARGLFLLEDVAQALGARTGGRAVGGFGAAACFSFFPTKNITTGEGGMLVSDDPAIIHRARVLAGHGLTRSTASRAASERPWERRQSAIGYNFRMAAPLAAVGRVQLTRLDAMNAARVRCAAALTRRLSPLGHATHGLSLSLPVTLPGCEPVYPLYLSRVPALVRDDLVIGLRARGIEASVHYDLPVPAEAPYAALGHWHPGRYPVAARACSEVVSLPMHPDLTPDEIDRVGTALEATLATLATLLPAVT